MKTEVEEALKPLVDVPLWKTGRAATMEWFQFGDRHTVATRDGETKTIGTWALHVSCAWRIRDAEKIIVASSDCYLRADHLLEAENFEWDASGANQRDQRTASFMKDKENSLIVTAISVDNIGGFILELASKFYLEVFPDYSTDEFEHWRLFQPSKELPHFVVTTSGLED